jgi:hypothetical protein
MRKILVSVALATATLAAVPAAAQYNSNHGWHQRGPDRRAVQNLLAELNQVEQRIERSARRGIISPREAFGLRREANQIRARLSRSGRDGLSGREFANLRIQVNRLEQRVRLERRDRDGRRG